MVGPTAAPSTNGTGKAAFYSDAAHKPHVLLPHIDGIPAELKDRPQWVCWRLEWRKKEWTKPPINPRTGHYASHSDLTTWTPFADALAYYRGGKCDGLGFVFCTADPFCGIDLDNCRDPQTGMVAVWARAIVAEIDSYCEVSPSGTGLKIIARGKLPGPGRRAALETGEVELYGELRYFTITGIPWRPE
jgi:primase-polymerase (primpol)-like protein